MKGFILLTLLFVTVLGEKKINLEDIERDHLHTETKSDDGSDNKYNIKEGDHYQESTNLYEAQQGATYADLQPVINSKYIPEDYNQARNYLQSDAAYQQQTFSAGSQQSHQPMQFYTEILPESNPQATHESQQFFYQPELIVGNQLQTFQQKNAPEQSIKSGSKESSFMDVPTTQQLSYYQNLGINKMNSKSQPQPLYHRLAVNMNQHSSLPVYSNDMHQNQFASSGKFNYHIQPQYVPYTPKHATHTQAIITKGSKNKIYTVHNPKMTSGAQIHSTPVYAPSEKMHNHPKKVIYLTQQQTQYLPQFIYTEPKAVYSQTAPVYADIYSRLPAFVQDNSLHSHANQYTQSEQYYVPTAIDEQFVKLFQQPTLRGSKKERAKVPEELSEHFVPPQVPAQKFKTSVTQLHPVSTESEPFPTKSFTLSTEPKSLLDSYIPSYVIAAQDTAKYKERPIKLEGGFLPSKINFIQSHKKRKSE